MNKKKLDFRKFMTYKMLSLNSSFVFPLEFFFKPNFKPNISEISSYLNKKNKWLYIHIPFCIKICDYCGCYKQKVSKKDDLDKYVDYLIKELEIYYELNNSKKLEFTTIMFWWWTASILTVKQLDKLFYWLYKLIDRTNLKQISFESSIFTLNNSKIDILKKYDVDRISIWIQSFDKTVLEKNNRVYMEYYKIKNIVNYIKKSWILVQVDLMIWIKWQNEKNCIKDFKKMIELWVDSYTMNYYIAHDYANFSDTKKGLNLKETMKKLDHKYNFIAKHKWSYLLQEDLVFNDFNYFVVWLWVWATSNIWNKYIYRKTNFLNYYKNIDNKKIIADSWVVAPTNFPEIKYMFEKYKDWDIEFENFKNTFWKDIKILFKKELEFLALEGIIDIGETNLKFLKNKYESRIYLNVFLENFFESKKDIEIPVLDKQFHLDLTWLIYE